MLSVAIKKAQFNAPIGLYPQEAKTLNQIEVDVAVYQKADINNLPFIDYTALYQIVKETILLPHKTLETIVTDLYNNIKTQHPESKLDIKVRKLHPPVSGQIEATEVAYNDLLY
jgi:dihydroneopterin aldolase